MERTYFFTDETIDLLDELFVSGYAGQGTDFNAVFDGEVFDQVLGACPSHSIHFEVVCSMEDSLHLRL